MVRVPSHLVGWLISPKFKGEIPAIEATVRCLCGSEALECHYPGACRLSPVTGEPIPCTAELHQSGGKIRWYFAVKAVCVACRQERVLFDSDLHGYYAVEGGENIVESAALPRPRLWVWRCLGCGSATHRVRVAVTLESRYDFVDATRGEVCEERWANAFSWFDMDICCCECGRDTKGWVSYEVT